MPTKKYLLDLLEEVESQPKQDFYMPRMSMNLLEAYILRDGPVTRFRPMDFAEEYNLWFGLDQNAWSTLKYLKKNKRIILSKSFGKGHRAREFNQWYHVLHFKQEEVEK